MLVLSRKKGQSVDILDNANRSKLLYRIKVDEIEVQIKRRTRRARIKGEEGQDCWEDVITKVPTYWIVMQRADGKIITRVSFSKHASHGVQVTLFIPYEFTIAVSRGSGTYVDVAVDEPGHFTYIQKTEKLPYGDFQSKGSIDANPDSGNIVGQPPLGGIVERAA